MAKLGQPQARPPQRLLYGSRPIMVPKVNGTASPGPITRPCSAPPQYLQGTDRVAWDDLTPTIQPL